MKLSVNLVLTAFFPSALAATLRELQKGQSSAKFSASWDDEVVVAATCIGSAEDSIWGDKNTIVTDICGGGVGGTNTEDFMLDQQVSLALLKIPQSKEILVGLSTQVSLMTINTATSQKGKTTEYFGNIGATGAFAGLGVTLYAVNSDNKAIECHPGEVTLASRYVELRNQIGGEVTYEDCTIDDGVESCVDKIAETELSSSIGLAMKTVAASTFNFVCANLDQDTYNLKASFTLTTYAKNLCEASGESVCTDIADLAEARVVLGKRLITAQQVQAVRNSLTPDA